MSDLKGLKLVGSSKVPSVNIPVDDLGTPGAHIELHIVPQFEGREASDADVLGDTSQRDFIVTGKLSHAPSLIGRVSSDFGEKDGDSFLIVPGSVAKLRLDTLEGHFDIKTNESKQLSLVEFECTADSPQEARTKFITAVYPALDHLSYTYNVPLFVAMIRVVDVAHQSIHIDCTAPYRSQIIPNMTSVLFEEMKPVYAMYREAKNTESDFYKFLCFYKIMEGLLGKMRAKVFARAKTTGANIKLERELVPDDEHLPLELRAHVGTPIKAFFDNILTEKFRNAVAHFVTEHGVLQASSPKDRDTFAALAHISDLCARRTITSHESLLQKIAPP